MAEAKKNLTITLKKDTIWKAAAVIFAVLFLFLLLRGSGGGAGDSGGTVVEPTQPSSINAAALIEDNDPVRGDEDAEISVIEFSDFQCPFCARAHTGVLADLRNSNYFRNGEVNIVYKHFPLNSIHPQAQKSAEASMCAWEQDAFWEYHDELFANQADWSSRGASAMKEYAQQLGLNTQQFNSCLDSGKYTSEVNKELAQATASGGRGTPYFIIVNKQSGDAVPVSGAVPFSQFEPAIQSVQ